MNGRRARAIRQIAGVKHARLAKRDAWWIDLSTSTLVAWAAHRKWLGKNAAPTREDLPSNIGTAV